MSPSLGSAYKQLAWQIGTGWPVTYSLAASFNRFKFYFFTVDSFPKTPTILNLFRENNATASSCFQPSYNNFNYSFFSLISLNN